MQEILDPVEVQAQFARLAAQPSLKRGLYKPKLVLFIAQQVSMDGGTRLTEMFIGDSLFPKEKVFEDETNRDGYPKVRAHMVTLRQAVNEYNNGPGFYDPIRIYFPGKTYVPVIEANRVATTPRLDDENESLILRAKTAIDRRSYRDAVLAIRYSSQLSTLSEDPRVCANKAFIDFAMAPIVPRMANWIDKSGTNDNVQRVERAKKYAPGYWETLFAEACLEASHHHRWAHALKLFKTSIERGGRAPLYFWWYPALLASQGQLREAIQILDEAVRLSGRSILSYRCDLALLLIMDSRYSEANEILCGALDLVSIENPHLACSFAMLYEAQDLLDPAARSLTAWVEKWEESDGSEEDALRVDSHFLGMGLLTLIAARCGEMAYAADKFAEMEQGYAKHPRSRTRLPMAVALIGLGEVDRAVDHLAKAAFEDHDPYSMWFHILPPLRHLRKHKKYKQLLRDLNLHLPKSH